MVLLAQFSDVHLGPLPKVSVADLASKRLLGYLNWQRGRARVHADAVLTALTADMHAARPDQIVVTGDLVNLGLPAEYRTARAWLATLGPPHDVTVIPGNHDAYVASGVARYAVEWCDYARGDDNTGAGPPFPFLRRRGSLALIGVSSAVPTGPLMATGRIGAAQEKALAALLAEAKRDGLFRVVLIHHPVAEHAATRMRRLIDAARFRSVIAEHGAELVLHGHTHEATIHHIAGPDAAVPVIGVPAVAQGFGGRRPAARFNLFTVSGKPGSWSCRMEARGITDHECSIETISDRSLLLAA